VEKSGSWFSFRSERIGQGRENARLFLKENKDIRDTLDQEVHKILGLPLRNAAATSAAAAPADAPTPGVPPRGRPAGR
jgi:recombination protein RecA